MGEVNLGDDPTDQKAHGSDLHTQLVWFISTEASKMFRPVEKNPPHFFNTEIKLIATLDSLNGEEFERIFKIREDLSPDSAQVIAMVTEWPRPSILNSNDGLSVDYLMIYEDRLVYLRSGIVSLPNPKIETNTKASTEDFQTIAINRDPYIATEIFVGNFSLLLDMVKQDRLKPVDPKLQKKIIKKINPWRK